jgi:hypothetical protein
MYVDDEQPKFLKRLKLCLLEYGKIKREPPTH